MPENKKETICKKCGNKGYFMKDGTVQTCWDCLNKGKLCAIAK